MDLKLAWDTMKNESQDEREPWSSGYGMDSSFSGREFESQHRILE